jgi:hemolysin-activating ACP:hemolysin acyltransferase
VAAPKPNGADPGVANGLDGAEGPAAAKRSTQGPTAEEIRFAVTFTRIVSVLTRSPHYKHYTLSDLEWLVVPPILTGQCAVMEANVGGRPTPVAVALWAGVSDEVDRRLSENLSTPVKLRPDEWQSGAILWLIDAVGDPTAVPLLLRELREGALQGFEIKLRTLGPDARQVVSNLGLAIPP